MVTVKRLFICFLLAITSWSNALCQDLSKENPQEEFKFSLKGNQAILRGIKKNNTGIYVIPSYYEKKGVKYPVTTVERWTICEKDYIRVLVFPPTLKLIEGASFCDLHNLQKVVFQSAEELIINTSFQACPNLKEIEVTGSGEIKGHERNFVLNGGRIDGPIERVKINSRSTGLWMMPGHGLDNLKELTLGPNVRVASCEAMKKKKLEVINIDCENVSYKRLIYDISNPHISNPWFIENKVRTLNFGPNVRAINERAFAECKNIKILDLSKTNIKFIGEHAFSFCESLEKVILPESLEQIDKGAFFSCTKLKEIYIPDNVKSIGEDAFMGCNSLGKVSVNKNTSLATNAFTRYTKLGHVNVVMRSGNREQAYTGNADIHGDRAKAEYQQMLETGMTIIGNAIEKAEANKGSVDHRTVNNKPSENGNNITIPEITEVTKGVHGRLLDSDYDFLDTDYYDFKDGTTITVYHRYLKTPFSESEYWYPKSNLESVKYNNAIDAAKAGWVYKKHELLRTIGKKD